PEAPEGPATLQPAPPPDAPAPAVSTAPNGQMEVAARVDGSAIFIAGPAAAPRFEVLAGQPVSGVSITGLPAAGAATWTVTRLDGRGTVAIAEQPSAANGFTVRVRIDDPKGGADTYRFRLNWRR
ncbi:MAG TPA: hypothetical protein DEH78_17445, partial [Solibacterales bacterium]|nr:hypothetical protein [Bryobacterales bacterium]